MYSPYHLKLAAPPAPPLPLLSGPPTHSEEIRTICISGLPGDVKGRELRNLLRWLPGFETAQIDFRGNNPSGFALFFNRQLALAATSTTKGLEFDPEMNSILHTEMAGTNIVLQRDPHASHNPFYLFGCYPVPLVALPTSAVSAPSGDASVQLYFYEDNIFSQDLHEDADMKGLVHAFC